MTVSCIEVRGLVGGRRRRVILNNAPNERDCTEKGKKEDWADAFSVNQYVRARLAAWLGLEPDSNKYI